MEEASSSNGPSSSACSHAAEAALDADGLARLAGDETTPLCVIDCRPEGTSIKGATRVRLPHVLLRRLQSGSMSMVSVCPQLADSDVRVVVVPEGDGADTQMSSTIREALRQHGYALHVFTGDAEDACASHPALRASDAHPEQAAAGPAGGLAPLTALDDVSWLNLKSLHIDPDAGTPGRKKKQIFPVQINSHLYLGNAETAGNKAFLQELGVTHIVNVTSNLPNTFEEDASFRYLRISVDDNCSHNLSQFFPEAIAFIDSAISSGGKVLVHCLAGISRSVTVCIAYLMSSHRWTLEHAYDQVLRCNGSIAPNFHFMGQLYDFERQLGLGGGQVPSSARGVPSLSAPPPLSPSCAAEASSSCFFAHPPPSSPSFHE